MVGKLKDYKIYAILLAVLSASMFIGPQISPVASRAAAQAKKEKKVQKIDAFKILIVNEDQTQKGIEKAYTFAGIIIDRARRVKRHLTDAEVKVRSEMPHGKNTGQPFDVILLIRQSEAEHGAIFMFTSDPVGSCRPFLKTFLTKTLSRKQIAKAYKGANLKPAEYLMHDLQNDGWLSSCAR